MTSGIPYLLCRCCQKSANHRLFSTALCSWSPSRRSNYYDLLGVKQDATLEEIKEAFFLKSKKLHPDRDPANPELHSQFVKLNEAYRVLRNENSRQHYDSLRAAQTAWPASGSTTTRRSPFNPADFGTRSKSEYDENIRYWQQFHKVPPGWSSSRDPEKQRVLNQRLFAYCLLIMLSSLAVHYVGFRKLEEIHNNFMDEKDRAITQIYNENKERARSISLRKQQELLRQKNAAFAQQYRIRRGQLSGEAGAVDSTEEPAPATSPAK